MIFGSTPIKCRNKYNIDFKFMKKAGFKAIDLRHLMNFKDKCFYLNDDKFEQFFKKVKSKLTKYEIEPYQMHGLWDLDEFPLETEDHWHELIPYYEKAMKACSIVGCKNLVIHPRMPFGWFVPEGQDEFCYQLNKKFIETLLPLAIKYDVVLCIENMPTCFKYERIDGILRCINELNNEHVKMCLDTGHYNVSDRDVDIYTTLLKINKNLKVLHVHDNLGDKDAHLMPSKGNIDWEAFCKGLKEIGFDGPISLETESNAENKKKKLTEEVSTISFFNNYL